MLVIDGWELTMWVLGTDLSLLGDLKKKKKNPAEPSLQPHHYSIF